MNIPGFCPECGSLIENKKFHLCTKCYRGYSNNFEKIKECIKEIPEANALIVSNKTGIPVDKILLYIKNGDLKLKEN